MGALPSRESNEGPNTVYFSNNTGVVTFRLPLTPHYFPSPDCLAFKEVHRVRDSQSCKYSFNIREASAVLPGDAALDFEKTQEEYWGPEAEAADPSLHYHDREVQDSLAENGLAGEPSANHHKQQHVRKSIECRRELYQKLVVEPTTNALTDTDAEMREVFLQERQWRAARDVVRRHRTYVKQQSLSASELAQLDAGDVVTEDVSPTELAAAEAVAPPRMWLRPIPEVVVERMSMEDACVAHKSYCERHGITPRLPSSNAPMPAKEAASLAEKREVKCKSTRGPAGEVYAMCDEVALNVLDVHGRQPVVETETLDEDVLKSYPSFQDTHLPFEMDESYMDGRVHMVAYQGVNYLFAYNPDFVRANGKAVAVDGSTVAERQRLSGAVQSPQRREAFTTTHTVATRQPDDFDDPNQRRAYEIFQPIYARYYIPVIPVRVLGVDGFLPCGGEEGEAQGEKGAAGAPPPSCGVRGPPWLRGVDADAEEEAYEERVLCEQYGVAPPPVLRSCRFVHTMIGDKILNRMSVLGCMTFRERCINAGLPDAIACPLWGVMTLSDIPQLQFQREMELRLLAAIHEIDDGDMRIRKALARQHKWNNYVEFTNSPMYGFMVSAPPERRFRTDAEGKLREVNAEEDQQDSSDEESGANKNKTASQAAEEEGRREARNAQLKKRSEDASATTTHAVATPKAEDEEGEEEATASNSDGSEKNRSAGSERHLPLLSLAGTTSSLPSSDNESRDEQQSGNTSARSAAHNTSLSSGSHTERARGDTALASAEVSLAKPTASTTSARIKRTRDGQTCLGGRTAPENEAQTAELAQAIHSAGIALSCATNTPANVRTDASSSGGGGGGDDDGDDSLDCLPQAPAELACQWAFKRRRLGVDQEVVVNPDCSEEEWMPMVNPLTKDTALARLGVRVSVRGRLALVRYTAQAMRKVVYYLSQASAPIFCLPYVGPPQQCPNVFLEGVLRAPPAPSCEQSPLVQNGLPPPTPAQIRAAVAAYAEGKVSCHIFVTLDDRLANPPTSWWRNHIRDEALIDAAVEAGVRSTLVISQMPLKSDVRRALEWYGKSLQHGMATVPTEDAAAPSPYASWPALIDAPAPCDGDVLVVCPRTHRWIRVTTLMIFTSLLSIHAKNRYALEQVTNPVPVLEYYGNNAAFAEELKICYDALAHKNVDSEGMQCHMLHLRSFFSYNGIIELVLDRLRTIVDAERYEDKDDAGWLVLRGPQAAAPSDTASLLSTPTSAHNAATSITTTTTNTSGGSAFAAGAAGRTAQHHGSAAATTGLRYMESGSYYMWSFAMAGQRYFFGTKPRFIRLALQRQKQNQRRRQKRKERDGTAAQGGHADSAEAKTAAADGRLLGNAKSTHAGNDDPAKGVSAAAAAGSSLPAASLTSESAQSVGMSGSHRSFGMSGSSGSNGAPAFAPQTVFAAVPRASTATHSHSSATTPPASSSGGGGFFFPAYASQRTHVPYEPLRVMADDRLVNDERAEMQVCRLQHNQWIQSRGVLVTPACAAVAAGKSAAQVPLYSSRDTARWEQPLLAGQSGLRRRLVVPIAPHGIGQPRFVNCDELSGAFAAPQQLPREGGSGAESHEGKGVEVPVQRLGSPRVVDAQSTSYRWNPYQVEN